MSDVFNWRLPPAPGFPGYQPRPQPPPQGPPPQQYFQRLDPAPPKPTGPIDAGSAADPGATNAEPYEPFIPSRADRPYNQWGTDDFAMAGAQNYPGIAPGPLMPQMRDIAGLIHSAVMGLGRFGSHYTGMPAIAMGTYASAYWSAYQKGMHERAAQSYQQYRMARQMTIDRGKEEMAEYAKIYGAYHDEKGNITDPNSFSHELLTAAQKYQNSQLIAAIQSGNLPMADRILGATDSHISNLIKAQHQEERNRQIEEERRLRIEQLKERQRLEEERRKALEKERQRYDPSAVGPGPGYIPYGGAPEPPSPPAPESDSESVPETTAPTSDDASDDTTTDVPSPAAQEDTTEPQKPIQVADASGKVPISGGVQPTEPSKAVGLDAGKPETEAIERAAKDYAFSGKLPPGLDKKNLPDIAGRIEGRAGKLKDWLDRLESDPNIKPRDISPAIRQVFPSLADKIDGYLSGNLTPTGKQNDPEWRRVIALGQRINPNFSQGLFQSRQQAIRAWVAGDRGQQLTSIGTAFDHAETLLEDLKHKPWGNIPFAADIARRFGNKGVSDLDADIGVYSEEFIRAMSGKAPTIPEINEQKSRFNLSYPESYLRELVIKERQLLQSKLREKQEQFSSETGFPAQDILQRFKSFANTDPEATNRMKKAAESLEKLDKWKPDTAKIPTVPSGSPPGSQIMQDPKTKKYWLTYPDKSVHELPQ